MSVGIVVYVNILTKRAFPTFRAPFEEPVQGHDVFYNHSYFFQSKLFTATERKDLQALLPTLCIIQPHT